ncbi:MAG: UMP kinase [Chlamydiota bacterium]
MKPLFKRILLKISGEALSGDFHLGLNKDACDRIASAVHSLHALGVEIGIVIGGGNFFRGTSAKEFHLNRPSADHIGMLATMMNGIVLAQALTDQGMHAVVMSTMEFGGIIEPFNLRIATDALKNKSIIVFVGGTGHPYFTTDTAAALRACEIEADILLKATKVSGIYNKDPIKFSDAEKYETLSYAQALSEDLKVMDGAAIALCKDAAIPIFVFNLFEKNAFIKAVCALEGGTKVS